MTRALLVATSNPGKRQEIADILGAVGVPLLSLEAWAGVAEPEESGVTFEENAGDKARYYAAATGQLTVAEDSGLEIDALGGAPGVMSARFPGETYADKFALIWRMLDERGATDVTARFVCALAVADGPRIVFETRGTVEGRLVREPRGQGGFGYDPIFFYPPFGCTLAEVPADRKSSVSHRGKAFRALAAAIRSGTLPL